MAGENFGKFGERNVIHQYFTQPNYRSNELAIGKKIKFANVFLTKTLKQLIRQSFPPPPFCAIRYILDLQPAPFGIAAYVRNTRGEKEQSAIILLNLISSTSSTKSSRYGTTNHSNVDSPLQNVLR